MLPDIMHDILEGTLQLHLRWLLVHFISVEKLFSLSTFNEHLRSFKYGCDSTNKPSLISTEALAGSTVKQSCKLTQYRYGTLVHYTPQLLVYETTYQLQPNDTSQNMQLHKHGAWVDTSLS